MSSVSSKYEETGRQLGAGQYGTAFLVRSRATGELLVMKKFNVKLVDANEMKYAMGEIVALKKLKHPNVIRYHDSSENPEQFCIFMEFASGGTLGGDLELKKKSKQPFADEIVFKWGGQLLSAIDYIHECKVMHRDIKPDNIFLSANKDVKLGDFGVVKMTGMEDSLKGGTLMGTPAYMALEIFEAHSAGSKYSARVDEWSTGIVIFELATLERPFTAKNINELIKNLANRKFSTPLTTLKNEEIYRIVDGLLRKDPATRLTAREALNAAPHFKQYDVASDEADQVVPATPQQQPAQSNVIGVQLAKMDYAQKYTEMQDLSSTPSSFGRAVVIRNKATGKAYVLKKLQTKLDKSKLTQLKSDIDAMKQLSHPQLAAYKMHFETPSGDYCILLDYYANRSLASYIAKTKRERGSIPEASILDFCTQTCLGLKFLHEKGKTHRDVKSSNIFFKDRACRLVKLGDCGAIKELIGAAALVKSFPDNAGYLAPEVLAPGFAGNWPVKSDMFQLGCVLYELATLKRPFDNNNKSTNAKSKSSIEKDLEKYSTTLIDLVANLLSSAVQRKSAAEVLAIPSIQSRINSFEK